MTKYQIWVKDKYGKRDGKPRDEFYTPDLAMAYATKNSQGEYKHRVFNDKKKDNFGGGTWEEIDLPNVLVVVERGDKQSRVRGFGIGGKWFDARDCKRCTNSGTDPNHWGLPCGSCQGSSWRIK